jgi:myo-inositol-1(or 4)-monophosphatase
MQQEILKVAVAAARAAGQVIRTSSGRIAIEKTKASYQDLVTAADRECQTIIEKAIADSFPDHGILGEESVDPGSKASAAAIERVLSQSKEWTWVIDPIDGTTNFVSGIPCSVVSIGVARKKAGVPSDASIASQWSVDVGVVYEPFRDELFTAIRGEGAFLNGAPISVSRETEMKGALFGYGLHSQAHVQATMVKGVGAICSVARGGRNLGSAALHLAYVSCGRLTGFWELDLSSWDLAAGSLLVQEAGGIATDTRGAPYSLLTRDMLATNGAEEIQSMTLRVLAEVGANKL